MPYTKQTWSDNNTAYPVSAARMNYLEQGVADAHTKAEQAQTEVDAAEAALNTHKTSTDHDGRYYTEAEVDAKVATKTTVGMAVALGG